MNHSADCSCDACLFAMITATDKQVQQMGWQAWYERDSAIVSAYVNRRCLAMGCSGHTEDIVQDAFVIAFKNIGSGRYQNQGKSLCAYLYGIARNLIYDVIRLRKRELSEEVDTEHQEQTPLSLEEQIYIQDFLSRVGEARSLLAPSQRTILDGLYSAGKSSKLVSREVKKSAVNVRAIASRAVDEIRNHLASAHALNVSKDAIRLGLQHLNVA